MTDEDQPEQPAQRGLGAIRSPEDPRDMLYHIDTLPFPRAVPLPQTVPLPPGHPWDQGSEGTCVGHSVGLAAVIAIHRRTGRWIVSTAAQGHRLGRDLYHLANPYDPTYQQGADIRSALVAAKNVGVLGADGRRYRISSFHTLMPSSDIVTAIESALANGMAVVTGWSWPQNWMAANYSFDTLPAPSSQIAGGHGIVIWRAVMKHPKAYDPSLRRDHSFENSWNGYFTPDGAAYFDSALERRAMMWEAYVCQA